MSVKKKTKGKNICFPEAEKGLEASVRTKVNLWMDASMHRKLKIQAAKEQVTITSILCQAADNYLEKYQD
jgi:hypothetical protein